MSQLSLTVWRLDQTCKFILDWGQGRQLPAELPLSSSLLRYFEVWQQAYLDYYRSGLRAKLKQSGSFQNPATDWRSRLAQAEANLLTEFHRWLSAAELKEIREKITEFAVESQQQSLPHVRLSFRCDDVELARLPWESWEISQSVGAAGLVQLSRAPGKIREATTPHHRQGKMRLLAIIGDDTGLSFQKDLDVLNSLSSVIDIELVGWSADKDIPALRDEICEAITDPTGWDVLFFAGHSNETNLTGGELAIAPGKAILLSEIAPQLALAKDRGLKFALFNSCKGLSLANHLIEQGFSHVAVMREPIRNDVAQAFLGAFIKALGRYEDVNQAMYSASRDLEADYKLAFPSAYLVPSLFQHPNAVPFKLSPVDLKSRLKRWMPTKGEAIVLGMFAVLSLMPALQRELLDYRLLLQGQYRDITGQLTQPNSPTQPPVFLVEIDSASISKSNITAVRSIFSREYLSRLVLRANNLGFKRLGIDYILDFPSDTGDKELFSALLKAERNRMKIAFATFRENGSWIVPHPNVVPSYADKLGDISLIGGKEDVIFYATVDENYATLETTSSPSTQAAILAFSKKLALESAENRLFSKELETTWITRFSYLFRQLWLHPILDYSIPPERVYKRISAQKFLEESDLLEGLQISSQPVLMIAPGYKSAGVNKAGDDIKPAPRVRKDWWDDAGRLDMSGGEVHAYHIHHIERGAFVIPFPDFWCVGIATLIGKWGCLASWNGVLRRKRLTRINLIALLYGLATLQIYITFQLLLPWLLPVVALNSYAFIKRREAL